MKNLIMAILALALVYTLTESQAQNMLSKTEKKEGWVLLFDGKTTKGWHSFNEGAPGNAWKVSEGTLMLDKSAGAKGGDIVTDKEYENFELKLEWKIDACGNSGLFFNVVEDKKYPNVWATGPEMQILDNTCHPDAKIHKHRAGDLYDLIACSQETVKPAGEWNEIRLVSNQANYEFWLNGTKVVTFAMHTPEWNEMVAGSKFKDLADFGKALKGRIALQDHGDKVWFRNIRIREIKSNPKAAKSTSKNKK